jgi:O-antigen ligase
MTTDPFALYALAAVSVVLVLALALVAHARPRLGLSAALLLVLVAHTKFRVRDPAAALANELDAQVFLELGAYSLIAAITVALALKAGVNRIRPIGLERLFATYAGFCLLSAAWSLAPLITVVRALQLALLLLLVICSLRVVGPERLVRTLTACCALYVLTCAGLVLLAPDLHPSRDDGRFGWFYVHPIAAGSHAAIGAMGVVALGLYSVDRWRSRLLGCPAWIFPIPLLTILVLTGSRGPLLAAVCALGVLLMYRLPRYAAILLVLVGFLGVLSQFGPAATLTSFLEVSEENDSFIVRHLLREQTPDQFLGLSGRAELWRDAMSQFYQRPLIGHGYQASRSLLLDAAVWAGHAHSAYIQTLLDVGVAGGICLFLTLALVVVEGLSRRAKPFNRWEGRAVFAAIVFILLNSITHESFAIAGYELVLAFAAGSLAGVQRVPAASIGARHRYSAPIAARPAH